MYLLYYKHAQELRNYQRYMIDNSVTLQLGMQVVIVLDENAPTRTKRKIPRDSQASDVK